MLPTFAQFGGAQIGLNYWIGVRCTWPLAEIRIKEGQLRLNVFPFFFMLRSHFTPENVRRLSFYSGSRPGFMMRAPRFLRIEHNLPRYPPFLLFSRFNLPQLTTELARRGFLVETP